MSQQLGYHESLLAELIKKGDPDAFRRLFEKLARALIFFGIKLTGDQAESEDAASDAFQQLWLKRKDMRSYSEIRSYLFTVVHNRSINFLKRRKMIGSVHHQLSGETNSVSDKDLASGILEAEKLTAIHNAIEALPSFQKDLLYKLYIEEQSTAEVAAALGKTQGYVRTTRARALTLLRKILDENNF